MAGLFSAQKLKRLSAWIVSGLLFALTLEVCARIDDHIRYQAPLLGEYGPTLLRAVDAEGIITNVPGARFEKWSNNHLGFRGPDIQLHKPDKTVRIVCMGTSETYGLYEAPGNEWPARLRRSFGENRSIQVINASVAGLSSGQYRRYIEKYVFRLKPDIVVLLINPISFALELEQPPRGKTIQPQHKATVRHPPGAIDRIKSSARSFFMRPRCLPKIKQAFKNFIPYMLLKKYQEYRNNREILQMAIQVDKSDRAPKSRIPNIHLGLFDARVSALAGFLKSLNIYPVLCTYPTLMSRENAEKYPELMWNSPAYTPEGVRDVFYRCNDRLPLIAERNGTGFVDLHGMLNSRKKYFADSVHYTDEGAEQMARCLHGYLSNTVRIGMIARAHP